MGETRVPPKRTSTLLSKSHLRRRLRTATQATRITDEALDDFESAVGKLADMLLTCVHDAYDAQVRARHAQGSNTALPEIKARHVGLGLLGLSGQLQKALAPAKATAPEWIGAVTEHNASPETA